MRLELILTAGLANLLFRMGVVAVLDNRRLLRIVVLVFFGVITAGLLVLMVW